MFLSFKVVFLSVFLSFFPRLGFKLGSMVLRCSGRALSSLCPIQYAKGCEAGPGSGFVHESMNFLYYLYRNLRHGSCWPAPTPLFESRGQERSCDCFRFDNGENAWFKVPYSR